MTRCSARHCCTTPSRTPLQLAALSRDFGIGVITLADRLHNIRTVQFIPQAKQLRQARESLDIFVPVAAQLSMDNYRQPA
jgi:GTP pyrophosphokinase